MKTVLITGATGFAGAYLAKLLAEKNDSSLHGTCFSSYTGPLSDIMTLYQVDMTKKEQVQALIASVKPDEIYHLAAHTSPAESFKDPEGTLMNNILSELHLFQAVKETNPQARVLTISTAEIYGGVSPSDLPIDEDTPLRPGSPYAVSKIAQDYLGFQFYQSEKLQIIRVRPFNHIGPGQVAKFVVPSFAKQIAEIEKGKQEPVMKVGNLEGKKDFTDVRDIVKAYALLMEKGEAGDVYNLGSGKSVAIKTILDTLLSFTKTSISVERDDALYRPLDTPEVICDATKIMDLTGWKPEIPLEQSLEEALEYFRKLV